jgi:hypothetical protein
MVNIKDKTIRITRGDSCVIHLTIYEADGTTVYTPSENDHIIFTVKPDINNDYYELKKFFVNGNTLTLNKVDTIGLNFGEYFYDVRLENNNNYYTILDQGIFIIEGGTSNARS